MRHPDRIYATVNGASTEVFSGRRALIGGWHEHGADRPGAQAYLREDGPTLTEVRKALRDSASVLQQICRDRGMPETAEFLIGGAFRRTIGEVLDAADAALAKIAAQRGRGKNDT